MMAWLEVSNIFRWLKKQVLPQLNFDKKLPSLILSDGKNSLIIRIKCSECFNHGDRRRDGTFKVTSSAPTRTSLDRTDLLEKLNFTLSSPGNHFPAILAKTGAVPAYLRAERDRVLV